jgi:6-pyruvoyl-tetrahydropterin synthase
MSSASIEYQISFTVTVPDGKQLSTVENIKKVIFDQCKLLARTRVVKKQGGKRIIMENVKKTKVDKNEYNMERQRKLDINLNVYEYTLCIADYEQLAIIFQGIRDRVKLGCLVNIHCIKLGIKKRLNVCDCLCFNFEKFREQYNSFMNGEREWFNFEVINLHELLLSDKYIYFKTNRTTVYYWENLLFISREDPKLAEFCTRQIDLLQKGQPHEPITKAQN